jgi:hypothetical protein
MINNLHTFPNTSQNMSLFLDQAACIRWVGWGFDNCGIIRQVETITKSGEKKGG